MQIHSHRHTHTLTHTQTHIVTHTDTHRKEHKKKNVGTQSSMHGNGWVEWGQLGNCTEEQSRPLDHRVNLYHTQVNSHMHRVTHTESMQMHTDTRIHKSTHRHTQTHTDIHRTLRPLYTEHKDTRHAHRHTHKLTYRHTDTHRHTQRNTWIFTTHR